MVRFLDRVQCRQFVITGAFNMQAGCGGGPREKESSTGGRQDNNVTRGGAVYGPGHSWYFALLLLYFALSCGGAGSAAVGVCVSVSVSAFVCLLVVETCCSAACLSPHSEDRSQQINKDPKLSRQGS